MATIFFDSSAVNYCVKDADISGHTIRNSLSKVNRIPIIGSNTLRELLSTYKDPQNIEIADSLILFVEQLQPCFTSHEFLYKNEVLKLKNGNAVNPLFNEFSRKTILDRLKNYRQSKKRDELLERIIKFDSDIDIARNFWQPENRKSQYKKFYSSYDRIKDLEQMECNEEINSKLIALFSDWGINFSVAEANKFWSKKNEYPALNAFLRMHTFLDFVTEKHQTTPKKDRITDSIQLIEASYCVTFLCDDGWILKERDGIKNGNLINADVEIISAKDFLEKLDQRI